ncbi:MAG: HDIG domain-containing protein [Desulfovibrionaceae bacterium]|nr:HDIG domain-containing protein [Desulfovibrionaceae bacterium]
MIARLSKGRAGGGLGGIISSGSGCRAGIWTLLATLLAISLLVGMNFEGGSRVYVSGEVADRDVIADRDILVQDAQATEARRKQVLMLQPQIYDLSTEPYALLHARLLDVFRAINDGRRDGAGAAALARLREELSPALADEVIPQLARTEVQTYVMRTLLPDIRKALADGLVGDLRSARVGRPGVIIRNLDTGAETLRADMAALPDAQTFLTEISARMRKDETLDPQMRRAINIFLSAAMPASLTLNREATQLRAQAVVNSVDPVFYQIQKGELVVRKGDRVTREQQIKLQTLHNSSGDPVHVWLVAGTFLFSLLLSSGFFLTPSGKLGTPLRNKDLVLISAVLFVATLGAKLCFLAALRMDNADVMQAAAFGYPLAAGVGLVAMVFAARRYLTISLLLAFFFALVFGGEIRLFLFHFLSAMMVTWLVSHAQNRQDVVVSIIPLAFTQLLLLVGANFLGQTPWIYVPAQAAAVVISAVLSLLSLFALSPILEMAFGYTTRFRLMELMSLEQPLMQELMVNMPGTYNHSLIVANMVEAGAKAVGANSLLCKVAALYHDVGKISYPLYFIENQFGGPNKHDKLAPSMSALVIISHVKKGTELVEKYKLGQEIADIIRQHHGTRTVRYFYQKAVDLGEHPRESDYSYPGPRPQTKEAAILMLADSVEASSRTLTDPTPARIQTHIDGIIKSIFAEGQLDESELTFRDLHRLSECFVRILTGIFHQRIAYPTAAKKEALPAKEQEKEERDAESQPRDMSTAAGEAETTGEAAAAEKNGEHA